MCANSTEAAEQVSDEGRETEEQVAIAEEADDGEAAHPSDDTQPASGEIDVFSQGRLPCESKSRTIKSLACQCQSRTRSGEF
mmetsp:Transcript_58731/g.124711  ORF Transcript_58731/g.124711 Transcript_58731/m.124711 type:complete len:82 (+) Transcript_58731:207-452(+)